MGNPQLSPGSLFANRFEIHKLAGSGGMGTVYRTRDRYSGELVALKLLHDGAGGADEAERFVRESQLLAELRHPGIVSHIAHGQTPAGQRFLAMEWLDGEDLGHRLLRGPLPLRDCLILIERVAEALAIAHLRGIIHRDIKPTNIFLVGGDVAQVKILDFGIARRIAASKAMTRTGMVVGTPEYMAPEQARGVRELSAGVDLFSLGCVLYECLTGQPPFVAEHVAAVLVRILFEEPTPVDERRPGVPAAVISLLGRLLCKDPTLRLGDAGALRSEVSALGHLQEAVPGATLASPKPQPASFAENEQSLFSIVLAAPPEEEASVDITLRPSDLLEGEKRHELLQALLGMGVSADFLASGALVVTVPSMGSATDQTTRAGRAALLVKERWPVAVVSMATGRGTLRGRTAVGEVVEAAARALKMGSHPSVLKAPAGVFIDTLSANLLQGKFTQIPQPGGALLICEEREVDASPPLLGKATPCVGREAELGALESQLASCIEESEARVTLITAAPGVGKSRVRHEFLHRLEKRSQPITLLLGRGDMMSAGTAYGILGAVIRQLCGLSGGETLAEQRERLRARIAQHLPASEQERVVHFVGELCHVPFPEEGKPMLQAARQEPKIMRDCLRRAVLDWLAAECAASPVLLVLDDLQWGDELTISVLDEALQELAGNALFALAFARPEVHEIFPRLWQGHKVQEIPLKGLSKKACEKLIEQVLGKDVAAAAVARIIEQSSGNALFLEELIRCVAAGAGDAQPETVLAMLQARIGRLESGAGRAVRAAAVFGQTFWRGGVAAILGPATSDAEVDQQLEALVDAELVQPHVQSRLANLKEYGFRHALVRDAAYILLTVGDLTTGHRLAGEFLEGAGEQDAAVVGDHFERGGEKLRAATWYLRAAEDSFVRGDNLGALQKVERGLLCQPDGELLGSLQSIESYSAVIVDRYDQMGEASSAALARLRAGSLGWCRAVTPAMFAAMHRQDVATMGELASRLLVTEPEPDARTIYIETLSLVHAGWVLAAPAPMLQAILNRLAMCVLQTESSNPAIRRWLSLGLIGMGGYRNPDPWTLVMECQRFIAYAEQAGDRRFPIGVRGHYAELGWIDLGDLDGARQRLSAQQALMERAQERPLVAMWRHVFARVLCASAEDADWQRAEELVAPMLDHNAGIVIYAIRAQEVMIRLELVRGRLAEAEARARGLLQFFPALPVLLAPVATLQISALLRLGRPAEATAVAEQVLSALPMLGGIGVFEVEFRLAASEAFHAVQDFERARMELRETLRQVNLRADNITDPFWKNSYLTRNPSCARAQTLGEQWHLDFVRR